MGGEQVNNDLPMWELSPLSDVAPSHVPCITVDEYLEVDGYRISIAKLKEKLPYKK